MEGFVFVPKNPLYFACILNPLIPAWSFIWYIKWIILKWMSLVNGALKNLPFLL